MVISVLVVELVYSSNSTSGVFAVPPDPHFLAGGDCVNSPEPLSATCYWKEEDEDSYVEVSQTCIVDLFTGDFETCTDPQVVPGRDNTFYTLNPLAERVSPMQLK